MLQIIHHPIQSSNPLKVGSKSAAPFSFHSLVDQYKTQSSYQDKASLERDGASNFLPELRAALPERLSKNLRNFNHQYLGKNHSSDFGIPTVFVRSIQGFLNAYHSQGVALANEALKRLDQADHFPRIFLKLLTHRVVYCPRELSGAVFDKLI
ncbi:hypothetical protein DSO57_1000231 [Entomophthora muscae]|uniref:Uncharacterized protein n=1 Tax=Entomophthora muscae TaxID=34485 RepID=A0ACC2U849_9FUNG|nr:hypothetical protein DSO57_1000231 [Entomophthora muscae]